MSLGPASWLVARPIAHRGLHDRAAGRVENSVSAARAAIMAGCAIECDVQRTADGEAVVFHDDMLQRLTPRAGRIGDLRHDDVVTIPLSGSSDRIPSLVEVLAVIAGAVPLVCEIKSRFDGDMRLADRVAVIAASYDGPLALKSFDPAVIRHLRARHVAVPLGMVGEAHYDDPEWGDLSDVQRRDLAHMLHFAETRPDFLSYHVGDLPHAVPYLCRAMLRLPVMTWTVRTQEQRQLAALWTDQIVFEGFRP